MSFCLLRSQKSISPARFPKPASTRKRPCGEKETVLRCAWPNSKMGSALVL